MRRQTGQPQLKACFLYYQGLSPLVYREAMALKEQGYEIDVICLRTSKEEKAFRQLDGLNIYCIQRRSAAEKKAVLYFWNLALFFAKALFLVSWLQLKNRYTVIHVTSPPDIMVFAAFLPKLMGSRILLDIHDIGPELFMRKLNVGENEPVISVIKWLEKISSHFADHVITVTHLWRDKLIARSVPPEKCTVLLNVPDDKVFNFASAGEKEGTDTFNLFYHGSIEEHCGVDTILEAMPTIRSAIPGARLYVYAVKKGRTYDDYLSYVDAHDMKNFVTVKDYVPFYELPQILAKADIGVVPTKDSVFAEELLAMKSLEYIFMGIPIVISQTKAHRYYFDGSMVKFFKPCDSDDLADAVISLYRDRDAMKKMVVNTMPFIEKNNWNRVKKEYVEVATGLRGNGQG